MMRNVVIVFLAACVLSVPVQAASVYVDASTSNTVNASDSGAAWYATTNTSDNLWALRTGLGNNDDFQLGTPGNEIFDSGGAPTGTEDSPVIVTTASGLTPGQWYEVRVIYWSSSNTGNNWCVRAGLSQESMTLFDYLVPVAENIKNDKK